MANAALVGANTVNGPGPLSVSTRPAALTAATSVVWSAELTALATMVFDGNIAWPPTRTVASDIGWAMTGAADASRIMAKAAARFMGTLLSLLRPMAAAIPHRCEPVDRMQATQRFFAAC